MLSTFSASDVSWVLLADMSNKFTTCRTSIAHWPDQVSLAIIVDHSHHLLTYRLLLSITAM